MGKNQSDVSLKDAAETFNALALGQNPAVSFEEAFKMLDETPDNLLKSLTGNYFKFEKPGQKESFIFEGFDTMSTKDGNVRVVKLRNKDGELVINGDKVIVSSCERLEVVPAWVRITYEKDVRGAKGTYRDFSVKTFPVANS